MTMKTTIAIVSLVLLLLCSLAVNVRLSKDLNAIKATHQLELVEIAETSASLILDTVQAFKGFQKSGTGNLHQFIMAETNSYPHIAAYLSAIEQRQRNRSQQQ